MSSALPDTGRVAPFHLTSRLAGLTAGIKEHKGFQPFAIGLTICLWAAAAVTWVVLCLHVDHHDTGLGWDFVTSWRATVAFAHGGQPYSRAQTAGRLFLYPPSSLLLMRPIAWLSLSQLQHFGLVATAVTAWVSVMLSAHIVGLRWYGPVPAAAILLLHWAHPLVAELGLQNVTIICLLVLVVFCWLTARDRWMLAAVLIGLSLCIKPLLIALVLIFLAARKWRETVVALAIPAVLNLVAFAVVKDPTEVFSKLPSLLNRSDSGVMLNAAWVDSLRPFDVPDAGIIAIRLVTAAVAIGAAMLAWQRLDSKVLQVVTTSSALLLGSYLSGTLSEDHYMLTLIPFALTVFIPGSPMRSVTAWIGFAWMMGLALPRQVLGLSPVENGTVYMSFGMTVMLLTIVVVLAFRPAAPGAQPLFGLQRVALTPTLAPDTAPGTAQRAGTAGGTPDPPAATRQAKTGDPDGNGRIMTGADV